MGVLTETKKNPSSGALAQLVAHRTFNPLVPSSSLGCSTKLTSEEEIMGYGPYKT